MKGIKKGKIHSITRFDRDDFLKNCEEINNLMLRILLSREEKDDGFDMQESKDFLHNLNADILTKEYLQVRLYLLVDEKTNTPLSFALFSQDETREDWHLEYIVTHKEYSKVGYAEHLFSYAARDIAKSEFPYISSVVNEDNEASLKLHEAFSRKKGVKTSCEEIDNSDELFDEFIDDNPEYTDYNTQITGYSNRISFLFDVRNFKMVKNSEDEVIL